MGVEVTSMTGFLIAGRIVTVPGVNVISPASHGGPAWAKLNPGDYQMRRSRCRQICLHTTKGEHPQRVIPGRGPGGRAKHTADYWHGDPVHSAAQIVVDNNGDVACLADLANVAAFHATVSNDYSVGIELYQETGGGIYEAVLDAIVRVVPALCTALDIPFTVVADPYLNRPLNRFLNGAPNFYGVFGHRHNTERRGRGDPGDEVFARLIAAGGEPVLAEMLQDVDLARARQAWLNARDARAGNTYRPLDVDGLPGPASLATARRHGFTRWRDVPIS